MALTSEVVVDKIEVLEDGLMQCREVTKVYDNGALIATSFNRFVAEPDQDSAEFTGHRAKVKKIADAIWTSQVKAAYKDKKAAQTLPEG